MPSIRANAAARGKTQASNLDVRFAPGKLADEAYVGCRVLDCKAFGPQAAKSFVACSLVIVALSPILVISILL
ncbi:hypothetical protein ASC75_21560 [Aminobacter sp. DSM 101952]|nr:hypothetical protein ASC75_21560 [Aminobacter sp. DSM 101952]